MFKLNVILANKMECDNFENYHEKDQLGCYLLVVFQSNILFSYDGIRYTPIQKNSVIIYSAETIQCYKSNDTYFLNSFAEFNASPDLLQKYEIPLDTVMTLSAETAQKIVTLLGDISFIHNTDYFFAKKSQIPELFLPIFETIEEGYRNSGTTDQNLQTIFFSIRKELLSDPIPNNVKILAQKAHMSESYFCQTYKKFFNITPGRERSEQIVKIIESYLINTDYSLEKISELCEISNAAMLIKLFKSFRNITPHKFRKANQNKTNK